MDDLSLFPLANGNHHYSNDNECEMFDEEENEQPNDEIQQQPPIRGRRKGVPRRLQLSPEVIKPPTQRLLPLSTSKTTTASVHHHEQPILTSDQEDENEVENIYHPNQNYLQLDFNSKHFVDKNNNHEEYEDILETVDDILADIVTIIVKDIKQQRNKLYRHSNPKQQQQHTNGIPKISNGKPSSNKSKVSDPSTLFPDLTKTMQFNSQQQSAKHKLSPPTSSSSSFSSTPPPPIKRQKTSDTSSPLTHQQLLWEMTQQLMMSSGANDMDNLAAMNSSLLKQQLLGLNQPDPLAKRKSSKPQSPGMTSNSNLIPPTSHSSTSSSPYERGNFAPRRRGRPPKYVTDRGLTGLSSLDLDPAALTAPYDQLFAAIENGSGGASAAAFQTALASMLGQQAALSLPPPPPAPRNGAPASMVKNSAGQTRHSLPASSKLSHDLAGGLDMPLMATKKRGPGRPPKSQMLLDPHQILQATQRLNSPSNNNYPPTMVPSSPSSFNLSAAFVEMLQQQQQPH